MAYATNRALYHPTGGRCLYLPATDRMLYHAAKPFTLSSTSDKRFYGAASLSGSTAWTSANYEDVQDDALSAFTADTSLSNGSGVQNSAGAKLYYGESVSAVVSGCRYTFSLPSNSRGHILSVAISAACGGWTSVNRLGMAGYVTNTWAGLGCTLRLMLTDSATSYGSGSAMTGTTPDDTISISACNDLQAGDPPSQSPTNYFPGTVLIECPDLVDVANDLSSDTVYLWAYIARSDYFDFLKADPEESTYEHDFLCMASFSGAQLKLLVE